MIQDNDRFAPAPRIAYRTIGGQVAIVKPEDSQFVTLNETGSFVWNHLKDCPVGDLAELLSTEFEVSVETALQDVKQYIQKLLDREMIQSSEQGRDL